MRAMLIRKEANAMGEFTQAFPLFAKVVRIQQLAAVDPQDTRADEDVEGHGLGRSCRL